MVGQPHAGLPVGASHVSGFGVTQALGQVSALFDHGLDLLATKGGRGGSPAQLSLGGQPLSLGLGDPLPNFLGIAADVERSPVASHLAAGILDLGGGRLGSGAGGVDLLAGHDLVDRVAEVSRGERGSEPGVDLGVEGVSKNFSGGPEGVPD